jgi:hypothetical protein
MVREESTIPRSRVQAAGRRLQVVKATQKSLRDWTNQNWRTSSGKPSLETGERYLPAAAWKSLSPAEKAATNRAKKKGMRAGKQFVKQPAKIAKKTARFR